MEFLKELIFPKTFNRFGYVAVILWMFLGSILSPVFLYIEHSKSKSDLVCGSNDDSKDRVREMCWEQHKKQYNKFGIPRYAFLVVNLVATLIVLVIYSLVVKSRVNELEGSAQQQNPGGPNPRKKLFKYYCGQLVVRFLLGIFFVLLQLLCSDLCHRNICAFSVY